MKTVSNTEAKKSPRRLVATREPANVTLHGQPTAVLRVIATPKVDRPAGLTAEQYRQELIARYKHIKPNARAGGAAAVRRLRDHGE